MPHLQRFTVPADTEVDKAMTGRRRMTINGRKVPGDGARLRNKIVRKKRGKKPKSTTKQKKDEDDVPSLVARSKYIFIELFT